MGWVAPIKDEDTLNKFENALRELDEKYYIMFELGIGTGLLLQDILKLKVSDVSNKTSIDVYIGVHSVKRTFEIPEGLQHSINNFVADKEDNDFLITGHAGSKTPLSREQAYNKSTNDITYLQQLFNHASPAITFRYIGEKPNIEVALRKLTSEENERSRYLLYANDSGRTRLNSAINRLTSIKDKFNDPCNADSFYGCVDCLLEELETLLDNFDDSLPKKF